MKDSCAILGASGHGKVVAELAELNGYEKVFFFDDHWPELTHIEHWPVIGNTGSLLQGHASYDVLVAIGNNNIRHEKLKKLRADGANLVSLAHPSAIVSHYSNLGLGSVIMANAVINPFCNIGDGAIINTGSTIDHDCTLADSVHISPGANIAGGVKIGSRSWIGIGSKVKQQTSIGTDVIVGAGSTVVNDIANNQTVVGTPATVLIKS